MGLLLDSFSLRSERFIDKTIEIRVAAARVVAGVQTEQSNLGAEPRRADRANRAADGRERAAADAPRKLHDAVLHVEAAMNGVRIPNREPG